jgi:hypothetical protein
MVAVPLVSEAREWLQLQCQSLAFRAPCECLQFAWFQKQYRSLGFRVPREGVPFIWFQSALRIVAVLFADDAQ